MACSQHKSQSDLFKTLVSTSSSAHSPALAPISLKAKADTPSSIFFLSLPSGPLFLPYFLLSHFSHLAPLVFLWVPKRIPPWAFTWLLHLPERLFQISVWQMTSSLSSFCWDEVKLPSCLILHTATLSCPYTYFHLHLPACSLCLLSDGAWWNAGHTQQHLFHSLTYPKGLEKCLAHGRCSVNVCRLLNN